MGEGLQIRDRIKELRRVPANELAPNPKNWRTHPDSQKDAIRGVLAEIGFAGAELARELPDGTLQLIDGHARAEIAGTATIPVLVLDVNEAEAAKILATFDPIGSMANADAVKLDSILREVETGNQALADMLTKLAEDNGLLESLGDDNVEEDEVPEVEEEAVTKPGDVWTLGDHRLICGDSTSADVLKELVQGSKADLWLTDPPYNVDYTGKTKDALKVANDSMTDEKFREFLVAVFSLAFSNCKPGASFYIWHADSEGFNFRGAVRDCGEIVRQCLIWKKQVMVMGRQDYQWKHEPCLYGWKKGASHGWYSDRKQTTVLEFDRPTRSTDHPTMKPVALFSYLVGNSTAPQGLVLDTFLGSGTTLIACEQLGRRCFGVELSPQYCDVIVKRWETLTGRKAECQSVTLA